MNCFFRKSLFAAILAFAAGCTNIETAELPSGHVLASGNTACAGPGTAQEVAAKCNAFAPVFKKLDSPEMTARICAAGADIPACRNPGAAVWQQTPAAAHQL